MDKLHKKLVYLILDHVIVMMDVRYKAVLECERIVVWGMDKCNDYVSSYRAPAPSSEFLKLIQQVYMLYSKAIGIFMGTVLK